MGSRPDDDSVGVASHRRWQTAVCLCEGALEEAIALRRPDRSNEDSMARAMHTHVMRCFVGVVVAGRRLNVARQDLLAVGFACLPTSLGRAGGGLSTDSRIRPPSPPRSC